MADDISDTSTVSIIEQAVSYARTGMRVFPVHSIDKGPMPGYGWITLATAKINEVVEDFDRAMQLWGEDQVSVAWALGIDGYVALDFDTAQEPAWVSELEPAAAINVTKRGRHLIFKMPPEVTPGNGISGFPEQGWGEVRGAGGYIIVAGPDRPGFEGDLHHALTFPFPGWLTPYGGHTNSATKAEVLEFARQHTASKGPQYLNWLTTAIETQYSPGNDGDPRSGRHPLACEWMAKVAEESALGVYGFAEATKLVKAWWQRVTPPERHGREWDGILAWAVGRALAHAQTTDPPTDGTNEDESPDLADDSPYVNWAEFWSDEAGEHEWLIEGFWPAGRAVLLHAPAKTGKSEFTLWCAVEVAMGVNLATGGQSHPAQRGQSPSVLYVDYEMTEADLRERLMEFGLGPQHDLSNLHYTLLTSGFGGLDTPGGAALFLEEVDRLDPDVIIFDTFGRAVDGDENEADTVRHFYRYTGIPLKQRRIAYLRVDHTGKDSTKGARGSSAKNDDVDVIWSMQQTREGFQIKSRSRVSWVPAVADWHRILGPDRISYEPAAAISEMVMDEVVTAKVYELEELGIDPSLGRAQVIEALVAAGHKPGRNGVLAAAIKYRREVSRRGGIVRRPGAVDKSEAVDNS